MLQIRRRKHRAAGPHRARATAGITAFAAVSTVATVVLIVAGSVLTPTGATAGKYRWHHHRGTWPTPDSDHHRMAERTDQHGHRDRARADADGHQDRDGEPVHDPDQGPHQRGHEQQHGQSRDRHRHP